MERPQFMTWLPLYPAEMCSLSDSIIPRIVRSRTSFSRYRQSLNRPSGRHFIAKEVTVQLQGQAKVPGLPVLARAGHFRALVAVQLAVLEVAGAQSVVVGPVHPSCVSESVRV